MYNIVLFAGDVALVALIFTTSATGRLNSLSRMEGASTI
jgi:hypothetical protein